MKGCTAWSYHPYRPLVDDTFDIYVCRVVPYPNKIHLEWLPTEAKVYSVFYKRRGEAQFLHSADTEACSYDIEGLHSDVDYEFYVASSMGKSKIRLARCGESVGSVVNYLHPDDEAYAFSGRYFGSPSLLRHPDGFLLASQDLFALGHPQNLTLIFRSDDDGESWHYVSELMPCFWGKMFIHRGELYMLACSTEYGDLLIGKSTDGGKSFSAPVCLLRGSNGKNGNSGIHKNPQNVLIHKGRIYNTLEWGSWENNKYYHAAMVMSCSVYDDLLSPESWSFSEPLVYDPTWNGTAKGTARGTLEGTLSVAPDGNLYNVMRYAIVDAVPSHGLVLAYKVDTEDHDKPLEYSHSIKMPCNNAKFMIKYDPVSKKYYSIVSRIDCEERIHRRNLLSLMSSADMESWTLVCDLIDKRDEDMETVGLQYVDFEFEGEDILYLCRTAINGAHNYHDANYFTFHRVKNFRDIAPSDSTPSA